MCEEWLDLLEHGVLELERGYGDEAEKATQELYECAKREARKRGFDE
jgi:hypothetical protein